MDISMVLSSAVVAPSCTATIEGISRMSCYGDPMWEATTTIPYLVPCLGCSNYTANYNYVGCNEGAPPQTSNITYPATLTVFSPTCSPSPDPSEWERPNPPSDITTTVPVTNDIIGTPTYTPRQVVVTSYAEAAGYCVAELDIYPTYAPTTTDPATPDAAWFSADEAYSARMSSSLCPTVTSYTATVHVTTEVDCGGCTPQLELDVVTFKTPLCLYPPSATPPTTVTATVATRDVVYVCSEGVDIWAR
jgi:hypothetical protein